MTHSQVVKWTSHNGFICGVCFVILPHLSLFSTSGILCFVIVVFPGSLVLLLNGCFHISPVTGPREVVLA